MKFSALVASSMLSVSFALAGCAADTVVDSGEGLEDTEVAQEEINARSAAFVRDYIWMGFGDFVDLSKLSLKKDGTYTAAVDSALIDKNVRCIAFPCTLPEAGTWTTVTSQGKLKLKLDPQGPGPTRSYFASIEAGTNRLSLTRLHKTTVLFVDAPVAKACQRGGCSGQLCAEESMISTCEWRPEYACFKAATCERQADGKCGFTATAASKACFSNL